MKLKPYPEYKDSGVPWLGEIPAHWEVKPGIAFLSERKEKNVGMKESTVLSLSYGHIIIKSPDKLHGLVPESFETYQIVEPGNIIIRGTDLQNDKVSLRVGKVRHKGIITSAYLCLQTKNGILPDYAHVLLHAYDLMKVFYRLGSGLRQNLSFFDFKRLEIIVPSKEEQRLIHEYVRSTSAKINKFIRNKRRLIGLLKEQKQNIINQAVTRGIDPNVKLKPSGVEWLGDIPEHWETVKLKHISSMKSGDNLTSYQIVESGEYPVYGGNGLRGYFNEYNREGKHLLIGRQGALCGNIHSVEGKFWATEHAIVASARGNILIKWYYYILSVMNLNQYSESAAQPGLSVEKILDLRTILPPCDEQDAIAEYIEREVEPLDQAIARAEREIELMTEYRARLISDVVTGKVDVRGIDVTQIVDDKFPTADEETDYEDEFLEEETSEEEFEDE